LPVVYIMESEKKQAQFNYFWYALSEYIN
jgi:hypothetical protein